MPNVPAQPDSDLDPRDPYAREAQAFPRLSEEMASGVGAYGTGAAEGSVVVQAVHQFLNPEFLDPGVA